MNSTGNALYGRNPTEDLNSARTHRELPGLLQVERLLQVCRVPPDQRVPLALGARHGAGQYLRPVRPQPVHVRQAAFGGRLSLFIGGKRKCQDRVPLTSDNQQAVAHP